MPASHGKRGRTANEDTVMKNKRVKHDSSEEEPHEDTVVQSEVTEVTTEENVHASSASAQVSSLAPALFPVARRGSVDVPSTVPNDRTFVTIASAMDKDCKSEKDRFKSLFFAGTILRGPSSYPATDQKCGFCAEALESSEFWQDGKMLCRGKYVNGARVNRHCNTVETYATNPTKRRHAAKGIVAILG